MATRDNDATKFETVRYEPKGAICHIILNRPEKLNAANDQLVEEVNDALFEFDADPELRVAIISGAGRAFCSGADVRHVSCVPGTSSSGWAARPAGARAKTGSRTPSTGSR
jgi:enoyl-CoA hydratase/carnithine racemase